MGKEIKSEDYHDYVIKDGRFVGAFEEMYRNCENPWPETEKDLDENPVSSYAPSIIRKYGFKKLFSVGSGKGLHANWLKGKVPGLEIEGLEVSESAVKESHDKYPDIKVHCMDIKGLATQDFDFDVILLREVLWYILPEWERTAGILKEKYPGKHIILEITCYDNQKYGRDYFDGPEDIIRKFPFKIKEILRHHITPLQKEGMVLILGEI